MRQISALQFEWAWQNPKKSRHGKLAESALDDLAEHPAVWEVAKQLTGVGAAYKIHAKVRDRKPHLTWVESLRALQVRILYEMLQLKPWNLVRISFSRGIIVIVIVIVLYSIPSGSFTCPQDISTL